MGFVGITFELGQIQLTEYDANDVLRSQPDGLGASPRVASQQTHHLLGFASRSLDPDLGPDGEPLEGSGGLALIGKDGTDRFVFPLGDPRNLAKLPLLKKGESMMYGPAANFSRCYADGSVVSFTTDDGTLDGKSIYSKTSPDGFLCFAPWGKVEFGPEGFHMLHVSGARIDAGAISGLPAPLDVLDSYVKLGAALVQIEAATTAIGTATGLADPAAKATPVLTALAAIGGALTAIQAALATIPPGLTEPAKAAATTAVGAAAAVVVPAVAAIAAQAALTPSTTTVT